MENWSLHHTYTKNGLYTEAGNLLHLALNICILLDSVFFNDGDGFSVILRIVNQLYEKNKNKNQDKTSY